MSPRFSLSQDHKKLGPFISFFLMALVLLVFFQVRTFEFINYDDQTYVADNPHITDGLTPQGVAWAFKADLVSDSPNADYWQPLTFISRMMDISLFDHRPSGHHLMNVWFHLFNTLILFVWLRRSTGSIWASGLCAALFAVHPLQVEPVAWVTARKDLLSTCFALLALWQYDGYVQHRRKAAYVLVFVLFLLGIFAKPMVMTLPILFLLCDFWPYKRFKQATARNLIVEKAPFLILSIFSLLVTLRTQSFVYQLDSWLVMMKRIPAAYVWYLFKFFLPFNLALRNGQLFYEPLMWQWLLAAGFLAGLLTAAIRYHKQAPYVLFGVLWFLVTLSLVTFMRGFSDRFMYLPMIGLITACVWLAHDLINCLSLSAKGGSVLRRTSVQATVVSLVIIFLSFLSYRQTRYWKNSITLFEHAIEVTQHNYIANINLGSALVVDEWRQEAKQPKPDVQETATHDPVFLNQLGYAWDERGDYEKAIRYYRQAVAVNPDYVFPYNNLGVTLGKQEKYQEAIQQFQKALALNPQYIAARYNLAKAYAIEGKMEDAKAAYEKVLSIDPEHVDALTNLGHIFTSESQYAQAISYYERALRISPRHGKARYGLGVAESQLAHLTHSGFAE